MNFITSDKSLQKLRVGEAEILAKGMGPLILHSLLGKFLSIC